MGFDISDILADWPYEHGQVTARRIRGDDGRDKIQLRLDLGLLQLDASGRPDGQRPHGYESLLDYYEHQLRRYKKAHGSDEGFELDEKACELLRAEAVMYYHRYLAEFVLEDFGAVERDTMRNVRLMDFCTRYAEAESDRYALEQYRPYVIMMCARARGRGALRDNRPKLALSAIEKGIEDIQAFYNRFGQEKLVSKAGVIAILRAMAREIKATVPADPVEKLKRRLDHAVQQERYEDAAALRDRLRRISKSSPG